MLGFGIILPLLPYYAEHLGADAFTIGLLAASFSFFQFLSTPIMGEISDKIGRRPVLIFSLFGTVLSFVLLGFSKTIPLLFLSRVIDGISGGNISTAQAYIADITTKETRTQGMGVVQVAFGLGFILGPALGGILSKFGYGLPSFVAAAVTLAAALLTLFFLPESLKSRVIKQPARKLINISDFYDSLTHPEIGILLVLSFLLAFVSTMMQTTFGIFSEHNFGLTSLHAGYIFAVIGIIGVVMQVWVLKRILKLLDEHLAVGISIVVLVISFALLSYSQNVWQLLGSIALMAAANGVVAPVLYGLISKHTSEDEQGNIMGVSTSVSSLARLFGPLASGFLYKSFGSRVPYVTGTVILAVSAILSFIKLRHRRK